MLDPSDFTHIDSLISQRLRENQAGLETTLAKAIDSRLSSISRRLETLNEQLLARIYNLETENTDIEASITSLRDDLNLLRNDIRNQIDEANLKSTQAHVARLMRKAKEAK